MEKLAQIIVKICKVGLVATMGIMTSVIIVQVIMRYVFSSPFMWAEELCRYMMIWSVMIGSTIALAGGGHIRVEFLVSVFPPKLKRTVLFFVEILGLALSVFLIIQGYSYALGLSNVKTPALRLPTSYVAMAIPFCAVMWGICSVNNLLKLTRGQTKN